MLQRTRVCLMQWARCNEVHYLFLFPFVNITGPTNECFTQGYHSVVDNLSTHAPHPPHVDGQPISGTVLLSGRIKASAGFKNAILQ